MAIVRLALLKEIIQYKAGLSTGFDFQVVSQIIDLVNYIYYKIKNVIILY